MNRNHFFLVGLVLLYVGLQFRFVETFVLNDKSSKFLAQRLGPGESSGVLNITQATQRIFPGLGTAGARRDSSRGCSARPASSARC